MSKQKIISSKDMETLEKIEKQIIAAIEKSIPMELVINVRDGKMEYEINFPPHIPSLVKLFKKFQVKHKRIREQKEGKYE